MFVFMESGNFSCPCTVLAAHALLVFVCGALTVMHAAHVIQLCQMCKCNVIAADCNYYLIMLPSLSIVLSRVISGTRPHMRLHSLSGV